MIQIMLQIFEAGVKLAMEAACIIFNIKPVKKADPNKPGKSLG